MQLHLGTPTSVPRRPFAIPLHDPRKSAWILRKLVSETNRLLRPLLPLANKQTAFFGALGNLSISPVSNVMRTRAPHIPASAAPVSCGS